MTSDVIDVTNWAPTVAFVALNKDVLAVARTRIEGSWSAFCAAVPGKRHEQEIEAVLDYGAKLPECVARVLFPTFEGPYAR